MRVDLLDHGYIEFIEAWGTGNAGRKHGLDRPVKVHTYGDGVVNIEPHMRENDYEVGIIEAARMSTQGGFKGWDQDSRLLGYLYNHRHSTPFEFAGMTVQIKAPIMVFREWQRHRTQAYNEASARYSPLPPDDYLPTIERIMMGAAATTNKQAQGVNGELNENNAHVGQQMLHEHYMRTEDLYQRLLQFGWPKELARLPLSVGRYSTMRATCSLRNWLAFMTLRCDPAAQKEIRMYADQIALIIGKKFPQTFQFWTQDFYGQ